MTLPRIAKTVGIHENRIIFDDEIYDLDSKKLIHRIDARDVGSFAVIN